MRLDRFLVQRLFWIASAIVILLSSVMPVQAAPGDWQEIASDGVGNTDELGFVRDSSGVLHLLWRADGSSSDELRYRSLSSDGTTLSTVVLAVTGWSSFTNPALRTKPDGTLQALFGGLGGPDLANNGALFGADGGSDGSSWMLSSGPYSNSKNVSASEVVSATTSGSNLYTAWSGTSGVFFHQGEDALAMNETAAAQSACCGFYPNFATEWASGALYLGWYSNATGQYGQYVQKLSPLESTASFVPESARSDGLAALDIDHRMAISGRDGAEGVYVAHCTGYPGCDEVRLWKVGSTESRTVYGKSGAQHVNIAMAPDGRLWIMWILGERAFVRRSNPEVTRFGRIQRIDLPGDGTAFRLSGEGSLGALDLLAVVGLSGATHYHLRVEPALKLKVAPRRARVGRRVRVTVTDAGDPISGAAVKGFGITVRTDARGKARLRIPGSGRGNSSKFIARKTGYANSNQVKVRRVR